MNEFVAKLTSLSYEFFGILLPGFIAILFFAATWAGLADLATYWTMGGLPKLTVANAGGIMNVMTLGTGIGVAVPLAILSYFFGHMLMWIARRGKSLECSNAALLGRSLLFGVPKPIDSFDKKLNGLFSRVSSCFSEHGTSLEWREFYPLGKCFLSRNNPKSLVATYQTKYTLHRSLTTAAAAWFWLNCVALLLGLYGSCVTGSEFHWGWLIIFIASSLFLVWGFADSYAFNWKMFGDSIVTESYTLLFEPPVASKMDARTANKGTEEINSAN